MPMNLNTLFKKVLWRSVSINIEIFPVLANNHEKEDRRRTTHSPISHNHSTILQSQLHSIIPRRAIPTLLQCRKSLIQVATQKGQQRDGRQQNIANKTGHNCTECSGKDKSYRYFEHIVSQRKVAEIVPGAAQSFARPAVGGWEQRGGWGCGHVGSRPRFLSS
jgi:hypothetical protein